MHGCPSFDETFRNSFRDLLTWRRDVRHFRRDPLPPGLLNELIASACLAPSVGLSQPWRFVKVDDPDRRTRIRRNFEVANAAALSGHAGDSSKSALYARLKLAGLEEAPVHLAVFADRGTTQGHGLGRQSMPETVEYSVVCAVHTLWLVARVNGIGMGWISILDPVAAAQTLEIPDTWSLVAYLCLGYPAEEHVTPELEREGWESRSASLLLLR